MVFGRNYIVNVNDELNRQNIPHNMDDRSQEESSFSNEGPYKCRMSLELLTDGISDSITFELFGLNLRSIFMIKSIKMKVKNTSF